MVLQYIILGEKVCLRIENEFIKYIKNRKGDKKINGHLIRIIQPWHKVNSRNTYLGSILTGDIKSGTDIQSLIGIRNYGFQKLSKELTERKSLEKNKELKCYVISVQFMAENARQLILTDANRPTQG